MRFALCRGPFLCPTSQCPCHRGSSYVFSPVTLRVPSSPAVSVSMWTLMALTPLLLVSAVCQTHVWGLPSAFNTGGITLVPGTWSLSSDPSHIKGSTSHPSRFLPSGSPHIPNKSPRITGTSSGSQSGSCAWGLGSCAPQSTPCSTGQSGPLLSC